MERYNINNKIMEKEFIAIEKSKMRNNIDCNLNLIYILILN